MKDIVKSVVSIIATMVVGITLYGIMQGLIGIDDEDYYTDF